MRLRPTRIESVPVPELSGLALTAGAPARLLAIGDRGSLLAHAVLSDEPLDWKSVDLDRLGLDRDRRQFEAIAVAPDGRILVLREHPPLVHVLDLDNETASTIRLKAGHGDRLEDVFEESSSSGEGLVQLSEHHLLVAKEKDPPLLVEFGPADDASASHDGSLYALAAWTVDDVDDISDLAVDGGELYCLSDQSRRVVALELPLDPASSRTRARMQLDLRVPEREGEPDGKPEGLVVTDEALIVGLDTETATDNLCWYERP